MKTEQTHQSLLTTFLLLWRLIRVTIMSMLHPFSPGTAGFSRLPLPLRTHFRLMQTKDIVVQFSYMSYQQSVSTGHKSELTRVVGKISLHDVFQTIILHMSKRQQPIHQVMSLHWPHPLLKMIHQSLSHHRVTNDFWEHREKTFITILFFLDGCNIGSKNSLLVRAQGSWLECMYNLHLRPQFVLLNRLAKHFSG